MRRPGAGQNHVGKPVVPQLVKGRRVGTRTDNTGPRRRRQLDRRDANTARRPLNQHRLAAPQPAQL